MAEIAHSIPPKNPKNRFLPLRGMNPIQDEVLLRPTFFQHFDGVAVDWKYVANRDQAALKQEAGWIRPAEAASPGGPDLGCEPLPGSQAGGQHRALITPAAWRPSARSWRRWAFWCARPDRPAPAVRSRTTSRSRPPGMRLMPPCEICREAASRQITCSDLRLAASRPPRDINEAMQFIDRVGAVPASAPSTALLLAAKLTPQQVADAPKATAWAFGS